MLCLAALALIQGQLKQGPTRPDQLPLFQFLRSLPLSEKPFAGHMNDHSGTHPLWYYRVTLRGSEVGRLLKKEVTRKSGWNLQFPSRTEYWQARAVHLTHDKADWHLSTEGEGNQIKRGSLERDHTLIILWDESKFVPEYPAGQKG